MSMPLSLLGSTPKHPVVVPTGKAIESRQEPHVAAKDIARIALEANSAITPGETMAQFQLACDIERHQWLATHRTRVGEILAQLLAAGHLPGRHRGFGAWLVEDTRLPAVLAVSPKGRLNWYEPPDEPFVWYIRVIFMVATNCYLLGLWILSGTSLGVALLPHTPAAWLMHGTLATLLGFGIALPQRLATLWRHIMLWTRVRPSWEADISEHITIALLEITTEAYAAHDLLVPTWLSNAAPEREARCQKDLEISYQLSLSDTAR